MQENLNVKIKYRHKFLKNGANWVNIQNLGKILSVLGTLFITPSASQKDNEIFSTERDGAFQLVRPLMTEGEGRRKI